MKPFFSLCCFSSLLGKRLGQKQRAFSRAAWRVNHVVPGLAGRPLFVQEAAAACCALLKHAALARRTASGKVGVCVKCENHTLTLTTCARVPFLSY
jgi:hypothetical protein